MKKLTVLSIIAALLLMSVSCAEPGTTSPSPAPVAAEVCYRGEALDVSGFKAGDTFDWSLSLTSENSGLYSGEWLIGYPEQFIKPVGYSVDPEGFASFGGGSDTAAFAFNPDYGEGLGLLIMYLTSFSNGGLNSSGVMVRITFELIAVPDSGALEKDASGSFLAIPIAVRESRRMLSSSEAVPHQNVQAQGGKLYFGH